MKLNKIHLGAVAFAASAIFVFFALLVQVATAEEINKSLNGAVKCQVI